MADNPAMDAPRPEDRPRADEPARGRKDWPVRQTDYVFDPRTKSPTLAGFLSLMPGLGQVYVGYYQRGFIHLLVAGSTIALLANIDESGGARGGMAPLVPLLGLFLAFFWLYNIIDAGRRASLYNMALQGTDAMALPEDFQMPGLRGSIAGGVTLMAIGVILLLHTRFDMSLDWVRDWWPMAPVLFGGWLVYKGIRNGGAKPA